ncbi:polysaccharide biosynthesis protein [Patescibacteria group bacterium]|nr:polysaccharide biosynthesis protein [Patescibacteria group bacterium]
MFKDKIILITGGTGSWGNELTAQLLLKNPKQIIIFSRSELHQVNMERKFKNGKIKFIIGDVRDRDRLIEATKEVDYIFHLAALKHVPVCEEQPYEAIKTNIVGTKNIIEAAKINNVKRVIDISSDKAVDPLNLYGMTKAIGERLIIQANLEPSNTTFVCIRGGNVLGTNGSVVPFFIDQIKNNGSITLTDKRMTRYFLTLQQAIGLLFKASEMSHGGETFVMKMPACKIIDLARVLAEEVSKKSVPIKETGTRPGEKIDEVLISRYESPRTYKFDENYYVILPELKLDNLEDKYKKFPKVKFSEYSSKDKLMNKTQVKELLAKGGFI